MTAPTRPKVETKSVPAPPRPDKDVPIIAIDLPVMYEDEGQDEMGESKPHTAADHILSIGLAEHLRPQPQYEVLSNINLYYHRLDRKAYVSPDVMVVMPPEPLPDDLPSYTLGPDRPAPVLIIEILSRRSFQQQDLTNKPELYAELGVAEYILVDGSGRFLPERLLLKRLVEDARWEDEQDPDGGVTSRLGFRIVIEADDLPRVIDASTGRRYLRPLELYAAAQAAQEAAQGAQAQVQAAQAQAQAAQAQARAAQAAAQAAEETARAEAEARRQTEERVKALEAELVRLRGAPPANRGDG
jgi:Uma2 family endonuclease